VIEVRDLNVRFAPDAAPVVAGVSFSVAKGETFGLVGESGCGKSTVLRALAGLITSYDGEVRLDGTVVPPKRPRGFFKRVQMVFQDPCVDGPRFARCLCSGVPIWSLAVMCPAC
jgi:peptide/nickel transport system ATP-binding protein